MFTLNPVTSAHAPEAFEYESVFIDCTTCITLPTGALASGNEPVKGCVPKSIPVVPFIVKAIVIP
jgi:hypothetical protein